MGFGVLPVFLVDCRTRCQNSKLIHACPGACSYFAQDLQRTNGAGLVGHSFRPASVVFSGLRAPKSWSRIQGAFLLDHVLYALSRMSSGSGVVPPLLLDPAWPEARPPSSLQPSMATWSACGSCWRRVPPRRARRVCCWYILGEDGGARLHH